MYIGQTVGAYVVSADGYIVNEYNEEWNSAESQLRNINKFIDTSVRDIGNGLTQVGDYVVDEAGNIIGGLNEFATAAAAEFMNYICKHSIETGILAGVSGIIVNVAICVGTASLLAAFIVTLGGGPENLLAASIAATMGVVFEMACSAAVTLKGVYDGPTLIGDLQADTCFSSPESMNTPDFMNNSLKQAARIYAAYNPDFGFLIPDWISKGMCENAVDICVASGFGDVVMSVQPCITKGAAAAAIIGGIGGFNPASSMMGVELGTAITGMCVAGVVKDGVYGVDECAGDMEVGYCGFKYTPNPDHRSSSQYSIIPFDDERMAEAQKQRAAKGPSVEDAGETAFNVGSVVYSAATSSTDKKGSSVQDAAETAFNVGSVVYFAADDTK